MSGSTTITLASMCMGHIAAQPVGEQATFNAFVIYGTSWPDSYHGAGLSRGINQSDWNAWQAANPQHPALVAGLITVVPNGTVAGPDEPSWRQQVWQGLRDQ